MLTGLLWITLYFLPYGLIHSYMASLPFKAFLEKWRPALYRRWYRMFYNAVSVVTLLPLLALMEALPDAVLYLVPPPWSYGMRLIQLTAAVLAAVCLLQTDFWSFLGIRQVFKPENGGARPPVTGGLYGIVRHPVYLFSLVFLWLAPTMTWNIMAFNIGASLYLIIGMYYEERKLLREFGVDYERYQKQVPILFPRIRQKH